MLFTQSLRFHAIDSSNLYISKLAYLLSRRRRSCNNANMTQKRQTIFRFRTWHTVVWLTLQQILNGCEFEYSSATCNKVGQHHHQQQTAIIHIRPKTTATPKIRELLDCMSNTLPLLENMLITMFSETSTFFWAALCGPTNYQNPRNPRNPND